MPYSQGLPIIPIVNQINPVPRIDTYLFKIHSNVVLHLGPGLPKGLFHVGIPVKILRKQMLAALK